MHETIETIIENFELLDDWEDKYRYLIEIGQKMPEMPADLRVNDNKVNGCASQVWVHHEPGVGDDPVLQFSGDSDSHIVRGLVALMIAAMSDKRASAVTAFDVEAMLTKIGLDSHLTPQRSNGLRAMVNEMKGAAARYA